MNKQDVKLDATGRIDVQYYVRLAARSRHLPWTRRSDAKCSNDSFETIAECMEPHVRVRFKLQDRVQRP